MQLSGTVLRGIEEVLRQAEQKPADAALRTTLRDVAFNPEQRRLVSQMVFIYFRWLGWLDRTKPLRAQLEHADELAQHERSIPAKELTARAVPSWVHQAAALPPELLREFQREPRLWLRARPQTGSALVASLGQSELHARVPDAVWYYGDQDLFRTSAFHAGEFEIQDVSSQAVGHLCGPVPGQTWWDACAGEGGKTLHLCDLMANKGLVWASDTAEWRLDLLRRRASRARIFNYRVKPWAVKDQLPTRAKFDGILVDAPCSGVGTWGRNPHARWTTQPEDVTELADVQLSILNKVANSVKPGGRLIYSVCTLTRAETTEVAAKFAQAHPEFEKLQLAGVGVEKEPRTELMILPQEWQSGGMFIAGFKRVS